jgi:hypothetical protein
VLEWLGNKADSSNLVSNWTARFTIELAGHLMQPQRVALL